MSIYHDRVSAIWAKARADKATIDAAAKQKRIELAALVLAGKAAIDKQVEADLAAVRNDWAAFNAHTEEDLRRNRVLSGKRPKPAKPAPRPLYEDEIDPVTGLPLK